jgi:hypothetical protein
MLVGIGQPASEGAAMASDDDQAKTAVLGVLLLPTVFMMKPFKVNNHEFKPADLFALTTTIATDKIHVKFDASVAGHAEYDTGSNTFHVAFTAATSLTRKALIVHEATHALCDFANKSAMDIGESESMAYIAQCQFARLLNTDPDPGVRLMDTPAEKDKVFEVGWGIAGTLLGGGLPGAADITAMRNAVNIHQNYKGKVANTAGYNGV